MASIHKGAVVSLGSYQRGSFRLRILILNVEHDLRLALYLSQASNRLKFNTMEFFFFFYIKRPSDKIFSSMFPWTAQSVKSSLNKQPAHGGIGPALIPQIVSAIPSFIR